MRKKGIILASILVTIMAMVAQPIQTEAAAKKTVKSIVFKTSGKTTVANITKKSSKRTANHVYVIQYTTKKGFKSGIKTARVNDTARKTLTRKLSVTTGKKYYARVREEYKVGGKTQVTKWTYKNFSTKAHTHKWKKVTKKVAQYKTVYKNEPIYERQQKCKEVPVYKALCCGELVPAVDEKGNKYTSSGTTVGYENLVKHAQSCPVCIKSFYEAGYEMVAAGYFNSIEDFVTFMDNRVSEPSYMPTTAKVLIPGEYEMVQIGSRKVASGKRLVGYKTKTVGYVCSGCKAKKKAK